MNSALKISYILLLFISCRAMEKSKTVKSAHTTPSNSSINQGSKLNQERTSKDSVFSSDQVFINQKLLKGEFRVKLDQYLDENCKSILQSKADLITDFESFQNIGDIDKDGKDDFVFVLSPLNFCEDGQSYYFSNPTIPRIFSESYCCHPNSIFSIGDIDEDGSNEIAQYYSSCSSRYKTMNIWTLKKNNWDLIGEFTFTLNEEYEIFKDFEKLSVKISKGVFKFLEISDVDENGLLIKEWKTILMK